MKKSFTIGTVLMEKNRWGADQSPTFKVSDWVSRFQESGFEGIELWANHALLADQTERDALRSAALPISVLNSYVGFEEGNEADQDTISQVAKSLGAQAIKYNVGHDPQKRSIYLKQLCAWRERVPDEIELICECHPGTIIEDPTSAKAFFDEAALTNHSVIIHPFNITAERLDEWFENFGESIQLAHLQMRLERNSNTRIEAFDHNPKLVEESVELLKEKSYQGAFTFEFTAGIKDPAESAELLFKNAVKDLQLFQTLWSRS